MLISGQLAIGEAVVGGGQMNLDFVTVTVSSYQDEAVVGGSVVVRVSLNPARSDLYVLSCDATLSGCGVSEKKTVARDAYGSSEIVFSVSPSSAGVLVVHIELAIVDNTGGYFSVVSVVDGKTWTKPVQAGSAWWATADVPVCTVRQNYTYDGLTTKLDQTTQSLESCQSQLSQVQDELSAANSRASLYSIFAFGGILGCIVLVALLVLGRTSAPKQVSVEERYPPPPS